MVTSKKDRLFFFFALIFFLIAACTEKRTERDGIAEKANEPLPRGDAIPAWPALALLKTGENPIWFELGEEGPRFIEAPDAASLAPFVPWPYGRFAAGMLLWDDFLVMAVNRDGFLAFGDADNSGAILMYRAAERGHWDPYTVESFFFHEHRPAALLYRNDFFAEPTAPSPRPQVYTLDTHSSVPLGASVPALESFLSDGGPWEAEALRKGPDGFWYFRMKEKGKAQNGIAYFRGGDLDTEGTRISVGAWRDSELPERPENTPPPLAALLDQAAEFFPGQVFGVRTLSPGFEGPRFFSSARAAGGENLTFLYGYCRETPSPMAMAIFPDGGLFYLNGEAQAVFSSLPVLPESFVYTGIAFLGDILFASWEEQQEAGIGAAGFMILRF